MKLNVEIKPREWVQLAVFVFLVYLLIDGKLEDAMRLVVFWIGKK